MKPPFNIYGSNSRRYFAAIGIILIIVSGCTTSRMSSVENASASLAKQLAANLTTHQRLRVGIVPLAEKYGGSTPIAEPLQESLKNKLFLTKRFDVVEDDDMQKVIQEMKLQKQGQGILREDTIKHMGELLGADAILVGKVTVTDEGETAMLNRRTGYLINYHLVPVKSGVVGSVGEASVIFKSDF